MGQLIFNGVSSNDLGLIIQFIPSYRHPEKTIEEVEVPGRNGILLLDKKIYRNTERTYNIACIYKDGLKFMDIAPKVVSWLNQSKGFVRLEDSYDPECYRMAMYNKGGEMLDYYGEVTTMDVSFTCKPERYLKTGDEPINLLTGETYVLINNETDYESLPEIEFNSSEGVTIEFYSGNYDNPLNYSKIVVENANGVINSEIQEVYDGDRSLSAVTTVQNGFPKLYPGVNYIKVTGTNVTKMTIKPRWWTL